MREKKNISKKVNSKNSHVPGKEYEVDSIKNKRINEDGEIEYLVVFKGFTKSFDKWLPIENLNCPETIREFERTL